MASKFISEKDYPSISEVQALYPGWKVVRVFGGWMVFEFIDDYNTWRKQK